MNRFTDTKPTAFQQQVLVALMHGAVLYAKPDGTVAYLSTERVTPGNRRYRCLQIIPTADFQALASLYVQPLQAARGTKFRTYHLTNAGQRAVGGATDEG
jgi:hypothetical protein